MLHRLGLTAALITCSLCAACGGASLGAASSTTPAPATVTGDSNQVRLTPAESLRLVAWAGTFRTCMISEGASLGPLEKSETQIRMEVPASVVVSDLLEETNVCGERQGGPPHRSSVQYRPGEIIIYLPKRCLLDKKVVAS
jgi:hypothetical protein